MGHYGRRRRSPFLLDCSGCSGKRVRVSDAGVLGSAKPGFVAIGHPRSGRLLTPKGKAAEFLRPVGHGLETGRGYSVSLAWGSSSGARLANAIVFSACCSLSWAISCVFLPMREARGAEAAEAVGRRKPRKPIAVKSDLSGEVGYGSRSRVKALLLTALDSLSWQAQGLNALRRGIVNEGMSAEQVLEMCGEPAGRQIDRPNLDQDA